MTPHHSPPHSTVRIPTDSGTASQLDGRIPATPQFVRGRSQPFPPPSGRDYPQYPHSPRCGPKVTLPPSVTCQVAPQDDSPTLSASAASEYEVYFDAGWCVTRSSIDLQLETWWLETAGLAENDGEEGRGENWFQRLIRGILRMGGMLESRLL